MARPSAESRVILIAAAEHVLPLFPAATHSRHPQDGLAPWVTLRACWIRSVNPTA